ncbi:MAG: nitroreductase family protein [Deltaproteobacteria bacterium]|nr:MAG: nitroreductase family protein [Deltaproteobacteria bacterium]
MLAAEENVLLDLAPDELLTTTRTVRKRLDFAKPVPRALIEECLAIAFQAPNGGNMNSWRWIAVDDRATIGELARLYNQGLDDFIATFGEAGYPGAAVPGADRIETSTAHLRENFHRVPVVLVPLIAGRTDRGANVFFQASQWGSILQAIWSFMLALRARGLGSAWTTGHLWRERETAELLGIPYAHYMQAGLFPVAYTLGTHFEPAHRKPVAEVLRWNRFEGA